MLLMLLEPELNSFWVSPKVEKEIVRPRTNCPPNVLDHPPQLLLIVIIMKHQNYLVRP